MIALALIPVVILGLLLWQEKRDNRVREKEWALERGALLQRIQAPEKALIEDFVPQTLEAGLPFDDDEAFWAAKREMRNGDTG